MRAVALLLVLAVLAGCTTAPVRPTSNDVLECRPDQPDAACAIALAGQQARAALYAARSSNLATGQPNTWSIDGRAAISHGDQGGNVRVEWQNTGFERDVITLSAPITRQSWTLHIDPGKATLTGLQGGVRTGTDAQALLRDATGWEIPVHAMRWWIHGIPMPDTPVLRYRFDRSANNRLVGFEQAGWTIGYTAFTTPSGGLPTRIHAERGIDKVRLVIDRWEAAAE